MTKRNLKNTQIISQLGYDRSKLRTRIVHLGFGGFYRGHIGLYHHQLACSFGSDWGSCVVNLCRQSLIEDLRKQDHLYSVIEIDDEQVTTHICGAITESLNPILDSIDAIIEKMSEPQIAIVSLTLTEKGYCIEPKSHRLDFNHPWIKHDLISPDQPQSAIGFIVAAFKRRKQRGLKAFSILSCDNLSENGKVTKQAVLAFAQKIDVELMSWIDSYATFPATMVDRIVPALTSEASLIIQAQLSEKFGETIDDPCGVICESFRQWVIEDNFVAGRPEWEKVGAQLVNDVLPYELMKLRMLNGSHSFLAYLGYLATYETIYDCMQDINFREAAYQLMIKEQASTLNNVDTDLNDYANQLIKRYSNSTIKHRTWQIAMDGSQKLPQRWIPSIAFHLERDISFPYLALCIAAWMRYVSGIDESGQPIEVRDPLAAELRAICDQQGLNASVVPELLKVEQIFSRSLATNTRFITAVTEAYQHLLDFGAKQSVSLINV